MIDFTRDEQVCRASMTLMEESQKVAVKFKKDFDAVFQATVTSAALQPLTSAAVTDAPLQVRVKEFNAYDNN